MTPTQRDRLSDDTRSVLVSYNGAPAALVGARQFNFLGDVRQLPPGHPVVRLVAYMSYYAQLVLAGELPGPYRDADAERFARFALIDLSAVERESDASDATLAARLRVPREQIAKARSEASDVDS